MFTTSGSAWPVTASNGNLAPVHGSTNSCADADRTANEQITGLAAELRMPCPHCGHVRS